MLPLQLRDAYRVRLKLKLASGCYILQSSRATFNKNEVNPTCLLCGEEDENLAHFLLRCKSLDTVRQPIHTCDEFEMGIREIFPSFQGDF